MMHIWFIVRRRHKIIQQTEMPLSNPDQTWTEERLHEVMNEPCRAMDIARPMVLAQNVEDMQQFGRTSFRKSDFLDTVDFDSLSIELYDDEKTTRPKSANQLI